MSFNNDFYQPNMAATRIEAEKRLISLGYTDFHFTSVSRSNGVSFYFKNKKGETIRVSDHILTGKRAFNEIQVSLKDVRVMENPNTLRNKYINGILSIKEYKCICKEKGFLFRP